MASPDFHHFEGMDVAKAKVSVEELVRNALLKAASSAGPLKLTGKTDGLFPSASGTNGDAIKELRGADEPLLSVVGKDGKAELVALAPAGFERIAGDLPDERVGTLAKRVAESVPAAARIDFIQRVIGRTPLAAAELTPMLEEAVAAEKAEQESRVAAAANRREMEESSRKALERALQLLEDRRQSRIDALRRELEAEGARAEEPLLPRPREAAPGGTAVPRSEEDADFRRDVARQLAASWRATWEMNKPEVREFLESAMWNINGLRLVGEPGERVAYSGRLHESLAGVFGGDTVRVVRPGWVLDEPAGEFVVLKAVVEK
jgi:hypothetical protein